MTSTAGGQTDTAVVTVTTQPVATLVSVAATPTSIALAPGGTQQLTVKGTYSNNATPLLAPANESFQSSDSTVATVSAAGLVTAVGNGTATITVTDTASGLVASPSPVVTVSTASGNGRVYTNGALDTGVGFVPFGGSTNVPLPAADSSTLFTDGTAALKVVVTGAAGAYSGGAWVASSTRDLRGFNALTFWAKGSKAQSTLKVQLGNDAGSGANVDYQVETIGVPLTTSWQQYAIPLPDPAKFSGNAAERSTMLNELYGSLNRRIQRQELGLELILQRQKFGLVAIVLGLGDILICQELFKLFHRLLLGLKSRFHGRSDLLGTQRHLQLTLGLNQ